METIAHTRQGSVRGIVNDGQTISWRGIRYAGPVDGRGRWQPPGAPASWSGVVDAVDFPTRAPQVLTPELVPPGSAEPSDSDAPTGEDCLFLNVTAPVDQGGDTRPVVVWFHGGGYVWGSGANYIGDGTALARAGVIVVTVNYRLGALGFLRLDQLLGPEYAYSANCGLLDQIAALHWVRDNISAFGGDAARITIAGVSAGGKSVANIMAAPATRGLFQRAIIQSGGEHLNTKESAAVLTDKLLQVLGIATGHAAKLLSVPADELLKAQQDIASGVRATWLWRPTVDGLVLPKSPVDALASGHAAGINLMAGVTRNEAGSYDLADPTAADQSPKVLREIFGDKTDDVMKVYGASRPSADKRTLHRAVLADERYGIPTLKILDAHSKHAPCWRYRFDAPTPGVAPDKWGFHGADVPYIWDIGMEQADGSLRELSRAMRATWVSFISGGKPEDAGLPFWPEYRSTDRSTMIFDEESLIEADPHALERQTWASAQWEPGTWWDLV